MQRTSRKDKYQRNLSKKMIGKKVKNLQDMIVRMKKRTKDLNMIEIAETEKIEEKDRDLNLKIDD